MENKTNILVGLDSELKANKVQDSNSQPSEEGVTSVTTTTSVMLGEKTKVHSSAGFPQVPVQAS